MMLRSAVSVLEGIQGPLKQMKVGGNLECDEEVILGKFH